MTENLEIKSEAKLSFLECTSIIVGHGVGSGILAVPFLASRNNWWDFLWIVALVYFINLVMHLMIAELSLNNKGAQFVKCFENELFTGKSKKAATWTAFAFLGFSVLCNVTSFISGSAAVLNSWFGLPSWAGMLVYYVFAASVVFVGMKLVGICEKYCMFGMVLVIGILFAATKGAEIADAVYKAGVDVILPICGGASQGVLASAVNNKIHVAWFDANGFTKNPGTVISSTVLKQEVMSKESTIAFLEGKTEWGTAKMVGMEEGYVEFVQDNPAYIETVPSDIRARMSKLIEDILTGKVKIN